MSDDYAGNIGSFSETVASWGVMKLAERGQLALDAIAQGEDYRALDGKLCREVVIKVLPEEFSQDEELAWPDASSCRLSSALSARDGLNLTAPSYLCQKVLNQLDGGSTTGTCGARIATSWCLTRPGCAAAGTTSIRPPGTCAR